MIISLSLEVVLVLICDRPMPIGTGFENDFLPKNGENQ